ncbi:MAG: hypothetical protein KC449_27075 [Anaerolineales bacterium]|nr:hypothetical protein [Anaerolineales bacterium]
MLLFRSEENIEAWCLRRKMPFGQVLTLPQVWHLSQLWYADRLSPQFNGRSAAEVESIFHQVGLSSSFWRL